MSQRSAAVRLLFAHATGLLLLAPLAYATTKGLNQIVTPDIHPAGVLSLSAQAQHPLIGNSQEVQFELGLTKNFELSLFHGCVSREEVGGAEFNLLQPGPHLLTLGAVNWSSPGGLCVRGGQGRFAAIFARPLVNRVRCGLSAGGAPALNHPPRLPPA